MEITLEKNLVNMRKCPRFESCNIPRCPLDHRMFERVELPEDEKCILISPKTKRVKGFTRGKLMRIVGKYIWKFNRNGSISYPKGVTSVVNGKVRQSSDKIAKETTTPEVS